MIGERVAQPKLEPAEGRKLVACERQPSTRISLLAEPEGAGERKGLSIRYWKTLMSNRRAQPECNGQAVSFIWPLERF